MHLQDEFELRENVFFQLPKKRQKQIEEITESYVRQNPNLPIPFVKAHLYGQITNEEIKQYYPDFEAE